MMSHSRSDAAEAYCRLVKKYIMLSRGLPVPGMIVYTNDPATVTASIGAVTIQGHVGKSRLIR